jgi:hypothetical protein
MWLKMVQTIEDDKSPRKLISIKEARQAGAR